MAKTFNSLDMLTNQFQKKVELFLEDAKSKGYNIQVFESFRTQERQQELYKMGRPPTKEHPKISTNKD
jgi:LAS superfamily LD-carboxypeptidase LdcB